LAVDAQRGDARSVSTRPCCARVRVTLSVVICNVVSETLTSTATAAGNANPRVTYKKAGPSATTPRLGCATTTSLVSWPYLQELGRVKFHAKLGVSTISALGACALCAATLAAVQLNVNLKLHNPANTPNHMNARREWLSVVGSNVSAIPFVDGAH
jgi:hypothetical protein